MGAAYMPVKTMLMTSQVNDKQATQPLPKSADVAVSLEDVRYTYTGQKDSKDAVKSVNLQIKKGEKVGLVGYSGSGKTTLSKLLLRFMDPSDGVIRVNGLDIRDVAQDELRSSIAYVPQEPLLFHRSIWENILYGDLSSERDRVMATAKAAYVTEFVDELPQGFGTMVGERGVKLSGGQRQRVAIARALLKDAPILVLDEATSALDSRSEQLIQKALWKLMEDRTAVVIAHRLSTIQKMDRIVVMDKGKIVQLGTHAELLRDKTGIYAQLWSHQSGGYIVDTDNQDG